MTRSKPGDPSHSFIDGFLIHSFEDLHLAHIFIPTVAVAYFLRLPAENRTNLLFSSLWWENTRMEKS